MIGLLVGLLVAWYADAALLLGWQFSRKWDAEVEHWRAVTQRGKAGVSWMAWVSPSASP